ncbi:MAG: hypothetical protein IPG86_15715 [Chitinophagaceae bacterium]|nr:hypothetical protein [Chitinophagaceae bacterium]
MYSFFIKDFFTKPFIIIGVSFEDDDFYNYALVEKDKHNINFQNSKFSYLIDIYESEQKDNKFKRDFNIHHLPKTSTHDFLDWIKLKSSHFGKQTDFDTAFKSRYQRLTLRNFLSFDLSFIRQEYVEQSDLFGKLCFDVLRSYQNDNFPLRKEFSLFFNSSNEFEGFKIVAENKVNSEERILINCCRVESIANGISIETEFFRILQIELPEEFRSNKSQWFSEKKPSRVVFCLASDHIDPQAKEFYQLQVKQYFLAMSVTSGLEYLVGIELVFLYWEELKRVIENDIYLYHKWIGREPQYVRVLSEEDKQKGAEGIANEFRDYLQDRFLPYFSRNSFKPKLSKTEQQDFYTESKFINLLKTSNCNGIILYGQGGSGKTRLMYELGYRMMAERYSVIDVNKNFNDVNVFNDFLGQKGMYILLFDYVEEQRSFFKIVEWIYNNKIRNVRFIANCRKSYLGDVEHTSRYKTILIDVGIKRVAEKKYKDAIVHHIIKGISDETLRRKLNQNSDILSFLLERPSFAVFIKYLYQKILPPVSI